MKLRRLLFLLFALLAFSTAWAGNKYVKVTSIDQLDPDKSYILVNETNNVVASNEPVNPATGNIGRGLGVAGGTVTINNNTIDIGNLNNVGILTLAQDGGAWTISINTVNNGTKFLGLASKSTGYFKFYDAVSADYIKWNIVSNNGGFVFTNYANNSKTIGYYPANKRFSCENNSTEITYLYVEKDATADPILNVSTSTLKMGSNPNASFFVNGANLENDVTVTLKDGSDDGFSFKPSTIALSDGKVNNADVEVFYCGSKTNATSTIVVTSGDLTQEVTVTASAPELFTEAGNYYISNLATGNYVKLENSQLATVTGEGEYDADIIILDFDSNGHISEMKQYDGDGDMIATLTTIKNSMAQVLQEHDMPTDFLNPMFSMRMVKTGDSDGSVYLCVDVPYIENFDIIKAQLLAQSGGNQAINYYLGNMTDGNRHYLCVDSDNSFGLSLDNGTASKWLVDQATINDDDLFTTAGNYYISNKATGKYVVLENSQLATVTAADKLQADIITLDFNDDGDVSVMKQHNGDGDMIGTLTSIKNSMKQVLNEGGYPSKFLDQMFTLKMVKTPDNDGSVYICVDVPNVKNFDEIRNYLIAHSGGNSAINFYLGNMTPGKRHYLSVDSDDSFGFTLDDGTASKWMVEKANLTPDGDLLFDTPGYYYINNKATGKYVVLENSQLATVTATSQATADIIILDFNEDGAVSVMSQYDGDGDMIATLNIIKNSMEKVLEDANMPTDFLDQMFTMKMVYTPDKDGSVYLVVDVPEIENFDEIRNYLIANSGGNTAINFYLSHMVPGQRHYLSVDSDDSFGFTLDNGTASKWMVEPADLSPADDDLFTEAGHYYINNKLTGKYVQLVNSTLADVTAETEDDADIITLDFNEDGTVSVMKQYRGDGDMIATLNMIKNSFKEVLEDGNYPTYFLDQMFAMRIVNTGDGDGSVYLCVDVPKIKNFDDIRSYLIAHSGGNQAVNFYLSHMVPGNRHYLCVDADDTFGFTLDNGTASKWMVHHPQVIPIDEEHFPDQYFREFVHAKYDKNDNWWLSQAELDAVTSMDIRVSDNADYANITDLTGIEWFTNLKKFFFAGTSSNKLIVEELDMSNLVNLVEFTCRYASNLTEVNVSGCTNLKYIQLMYDDAIAGVDLTNNTNLVEIDIENCNAFSELTIPTLPLLESFTLRNCDAFKNQTIDLTNDNNLYVLSLAGGVRNNLIKGVSKDMTNLRYISADYNNFEDDVLDLTGCQYLFNLSLVNCGLRELLLNGCTNLGTRQKSRPNKPEQDGSLTIHSNYLRALDLSGVTGDIDETAPRNYNYNLSSNYPDLFPASNYIMHSGYNGQITTKVKPDVSYWRYGVEGNNITYSYLVYLRLDATQSEETEGSFVNSLMEVGPTNYVVDRVKQWVRFESGHGNPEDVIVEKDILEFVHGNKRNVSGIASRDLDIGTELDPDKIPGDILSLGIYTVPKGAGEQTVSGKIAYLYNVKQDVDIESVQVDNPDEQLDTQTKIRDYYVSNALTEDGDNLFPFEVEWEIVLSDKPEEIITAIDTLTLNKEVSKVTYVNLMGVESDRPFEGVNIVITHYTDGSVTTTKEIR